MNGRIFNMSQWVIFLSLFPGQKSQPNFLVGDDRASEMLLKSQYLKNCQN